MVSASVSSVVLLNLFGSFLCVSHAFSISQHLTQRPFATPTDDSTKRIRPSTLHHPLSSSTRHPSLDSTALSASPNRRAIISSSSQRRTLLLRTLLPAIIFCTTSAVVMPSADAAAANQQTPPGGGMEKVTNMTPSEARVRLSEAQKSLEYLIEHFDEISGVGGDNVRRYLGTVGTSSGMYGITKAMKVLQEESSDIVEYTETMNEVNACINGADGSAYMAIFVTSSTSYTPPQKYFDEAKIETKRALKSLKDLEKAL